MSIIDLTAQAFVAGYKPHSEQKDVLWLCNHPESLDLIFSKDKTKAFVFEDELTAINAIKAILAAENRSWLCSVVKAVQESPSQVAQIQNKDKSMSLKEVQVKINEFLKLFNERSNSRLDLFLTVNQKDNTIRGYGNGLRLGDSIANFVALLVIKGFNAQCLNKNTFIVKLK